MTDVDAWVSVARLIRPQGRRGEILAEILTDFPQRFTQMPKAFLARGDRSSPKPVVIEEAWLHKGRVVLKFAGVDSISAAEEIRGAELVVPVAERISLDPGAAYIGDVIGCQVWDENRRGDPVIGTVREVIRQENTADLLVVIGTDGSEHWIPFAKAYLVKMDLHGRRLEMRLPAGLLEVNAPPSEEELRAQQSGPNRSTE